jgi:hypothetical protein
MDIEIIRFRFKADAPNLFQDHGAGNNPACVSAQKLQQSEFLRRESDWPASQSYFSLQKIQF